jgi:hypothetical protein
MSAKDEILNQVKILRELEPGGFIFHHYKRLNVIQAAVNILNRQGFLVEISEDKVMRLSNELKTKIDV